MSDLCIVCAEPLKYCAYGSCGHKDACSSCVVRLRSVLKDQRCVYCQQQLPSVFITHFAGDYTSQVSPEEFEKLPARAKAGELKCLHSVQAYFDDPAHFQEIRGLCSYTHPKTQPPGAPLKSFDSVNSLKKYVNQKFKLNFCDVCLQGRKVFISEQQLYTTKALERHMRQGDDEGPMNSNVFKGHPQCRFCSTRFYGENEIYQHMTTNHEECFLCRRVHPHRHIYYRDYLDLEGHFEQQHFPCRHPTCLEQKFVVFPSEQELKQHTAREHGESMSRAEKKAALAIPVSFNYRGSSGTGSSSRGPDLAAVEQRVVEAATSNRDQPALLNDVNFPAVGPSQSRTTGPAIGGRWAGAGGSSGGDLRSSEDFPALPGTSKSARKRAAAKAKRSTADIVGSVRVVGSSGPGSSSNPDHFPSLAASNAARQQQPTVQHTDDMHALEAEFQPVQRQPSSLRRPPSSQEILEPLHTSSQFPTLAASTAARPTSAQGQLPPPPSAAPSGVSEKLRAANKALADKVKSRLGSGDRFTEFKSSSAAWVKGQVDSKTYHDKIVQLGLASLVPELAATCPDDAKRAELLTVHAGAFSDNGPQPGQASWVPPEAAAAAADYASRHSSWTCGRCTLANAPNTATCEACGLPKPVVASGGSSGTASMWRGGGGSQQSTAALVAPSSGRPPMSSSSSAPRPTAAAMVNPQPPASLVDDFPSLSVNGGTSTNGGGASTSSGGGSASGSGAGSKKNKGGKKSLHEFMATTKSHTQNVWKNTNLRGQWNAAGSLAQEERALNDAWSKK